MLDTSKLTNGELVYLHTLMMNASGYRPHQTESGLYSSTSDEIDLRKITRPYKQLEELYCGGFFQGKYQESEIRKWFDAKGLDSDGSVFVPPVDESVGVTPSPDENGKLTISVYIDNGNVFEYQVDSVASAREHVDAIIKNGYRHTPKGSNDLTVFGPRRINKIKVTGGAGETNYKDKVRPT